MEHPEKDVDARLTELEVAVATLTSDHGRVMNAIFNGDDGEHGLMAFMSRQDGRAIALAEALTARDKQEERRWKLATLVLGILTLLVMAVVGLEANRQNHSGLLKVPKITVSQDNEQVNDARKEVPKMDAGTPSDFTPRPR